MLHLELVPWVNGETVVYPVVINLNFQKIRNCLCDVTPTVFGYNIFMWLLCAVTIAWKT